MKIGITVSPEAEGSRLDNILKGAIENCSRSQLQKAIKDGNCQVDGRIAQDPAAKPCAGQKIIVEIREPQARLAPGDGDLQVLWQDEHLAVIVKPAGLTAHPCPSCQNEETLAHRLVARFPELSALDGERPGIVHRLDRDTSGLMLVALNQDAGLKLAKAFAAREIHKQYLALVYGQPADSGECHEPIGRHPALKTRMAVVCKSHGGRDARTAWRALWRAGDISLLAVRIGTGRTHQIRVHLAHVGTPIIGDRVYGNPAAARMAPRQMLHAWRIELAHPVSGKKLAFCAPPPPDFYEAVLNASRRMRRIVVTGNAGSGKSTFCKALAKNGMDTISADAIVAKLYAGKSQATEWIASHLGEDALDGSRAVNKISLFKILESRPDMRRELEKVVHGLVLEEIEKFWRLLEKNGKTFGCAEIPLYFESGFSSLVLPRPYVVGIRCGRAARENRLAASRGWENGKINSIEAWQWPEDRKMAACDEVVVNEGGEAELEKEAKKFLEKAAQKIRDEEHELCERLRHLCGCG